MPLLAPFSCLVFVFPLSLLSTFGTTWDPPSLSLAGLSNSGTTLEPPSSSLARLSTFGTTSEPLSSLEVPFEPQGFRLCMKNYSFYIAIRFYQYSILIIDRRKRDRSFVTEIQAKKKKKYPSWATAFVTIERRKLPWNLSYDFVVMKSYLSRAISWVGSGSSADAGGMGVGVVLSFIVLPRALATAHTTRITAIVFIVELPATATFFGRCGEKKTYSKEFRLFLCFRTTFERVDFPSLRCSVCEAQNLPWDTQALHKPFKLLMHLTFVLKRLTMATSSYIYMSPYLFFRDRF